MNTKEKGPFKVKINWNRMILGLGLGVGAGMLMVEPAFASGGGGTAGFGAFQSKITQQTNAASGVAKTVLLTAAVLSLIVGLAPMLWGQIKVKWIVTALCACVLFALTGVAVTAFSGQTVAGPGE